MHSEPIATEDDYQAALHRLEQIFFADTGSADGDEAEHLTLLIQDYERQHYPISPPDPIDAIHFRMEQQCRWYRKADT